MAVDVNRLLLKLFEEFQVEQISGAVVRVELSVDNIIYCAFSDSC